jgi:hypothetical protein
MWCCLIAIVQLLLSVAPASRARSTNLLMSSTASKPSFHQRECAALIPFDPSTTRPKTVVDGECWIREEHTPSQVSTLKWCHNLLALTCNGF